LTNDDKEDSHEKFNDERDKLKKKLYGLKNDSITNFTKIEDEYIKQLIEQADYLKKIQSNKNFENNKTLFDQKILVKNIFDEDMSEVLINLNLSSMTPRSTNPNTRATNTDLTELSSFLNLRMGTMSML
jgi:hypothetical protein